MNIQGEKIGIKLIKRDKKETKMNIWTQNWTSGSKKGSGDSNFCLQILSLDFASINVNETNSGDQIGRRKLESGDKNEHLVENRYILSPKLYLNICW